MAELWPDGPVELPHEFVLDEFRLTLPEIPTVTLFGWLSSGAWWQLFPQAIDDLQLLSFNLRFIDDRDVFDFEHMCDVATVLFAALAGTRPRDGAGTGWWPAVRLAASARVNWPVYVGWCGAHGTDPLDGPLWQVIGNIYGWLRDGRGGNPDELAKLDQTIWAPPPVAATTSATAELPRHVRDEEAALALAALHEAVPGEIRETEWTPPPD